MKKKMLENNALASVSDVTCLFARDVGGMTPK